MRLTFLLLFCFFLVTTPSYAEVVYITDDIEVMVRSGPGMDQKIISMPTAGTQVEVLERSGTGWSKVRLPNKKVGWMINRYLTKAPPDKTVVAKLKQENEVLREQIDSLIEENPQLKEERDGLQQALAEQIETSKALKESYETLKSESSDFFALKASHEKASAELGKVNKERTRLEEELKKLESAKNLKWFLSGAGVFFVGLIVGLIAKRPKRRRPSLL